MKSHALHLRNIAQGISKFEVPQPPKLLISRFLVRYSIFNNRWAQSVKKEILASRQGQLDGSPVQVRHEHSGGIRSVPPKSLRQG